MKILGIETSCDETAVCLIEAKGDIAGFSYSVFGNALISQASLHAEFGGVFPNLAKREHGRNLVPLLIQALGDKKSKNKIETLSAQTKTEIQELLNRETELCELLIPFLENTPKPEIDAIAVTYGPGLEPALWVGINCAKALSLAWNVPIVPVNHMEGHLILSALAGQNEKYQVSSNKYQKNSEIKFPLLALLISGGHTELILSTEWMQYELLGQTRDDAIGEAFDKVARLMQLPYPGGPEIERLARVAREENIVSSFKLPRPMIDSDNYDFSFAGLKTAVRKIVEAQNSTDDQFKKMLAREFEDAVTEVVVAKTLRAIEEFNVKTLVVGGGVSANQHIRDALVHAITNFDTSIRVRIPLPELATDNALMIALAGYFHAQKNPPISGFTALASIRAIGNLKLASKD